MNKKNNSRKQKGRAGRDLKMVGGNNTESNNYFLIGIFIFFVLAMGGLAWSMIVGSNRNQGEQNPQIEQPLQEQ